MNYAALEEDLKDKLNAAFVADSLDGFFEAVVMPESPKELLKAYTKGRAYVSYMGSSYGTPINTDTIEQMETVRVGVIMRCSTVRDNKGTYALLGAVKKALLGYRPNGARNRIWISDYVGWNIEDATIADVIVLSFDTVEVQRIAEPAGDAVLNSDEPAVTEGGNWMQVDSDLYDVQPEPDEQIGTEEIILADEMPEEE